MSDLIQRLRFDADCVLNSELGSKGFRGDLVRDFREAADRIAELEHLLGFDLPDHAEASHE